MVGPYIHTAPERLCVGNGHTHRTACSCRNTAEDKPANMKYTSSSFNKRHHGAASFIYLCPIRFSTKRTGLNSVW